MKSSINYKSIVHMDGVYLQSVAWSPEDTPPFSLASREENYWSLSGLSLVNQLLLLGVWRRSFNFFLLLQFWYK